MLASASLATSISPHDLLGFQAKPHALQQAALSLGIGTASTAIALGVALWLAVSPRQLDKRSVLGWYLAVPHLAFVVGLVFIIMPAGVIARLFYDVPPQWLTVQDPHGIGLAASLALKEVPFLLWLLTATLTRPDFAKALAAQLRVAQSLGHGTSSTAWRVVAPQLLSQLAWPIIIVWVYGCSVVDMALVIGPTQPAPLQISIWRDLNDAEVAINMRGLAGVGFLTMLLAGFLCVFAGCAKLVKPWLRGWLVRGPSLRNSNVLLPCLARYMIGLVYAAVLFILVLLSLTTRWPFPLLWPEAFSATAWVALIEHPQAILNSLGFAVATSTSALMLSLLWFECCPRRWDNVLAGAALFSLAFPAIALAAGQYQFLLQFHLNGTVFGVFLAQLAPVFAYAFLTLMGPYRAFDERFRSVAHSLNGSDYRFLVRIKWPLLLRPLASAAAIGFAVSMGQYISVQLVGAGNFPTLTTEAVTLASGGNRAVLATYALALTAITAAVFALATLTGSRRDA